MIALVGTPALKKNNNNIEVGFIFLDFKYAETMVHWSLWHPDGYSELGEACLLTLHVAGAGALVDPLKSSLRIC